MFCNARHCRRFQTIAVGFLPTAGRMDFIYCPQAFIVVCFAKASAFSLSNQPQKGYFLRLLRRLGQLIPFPIPRPLHPIAFPLPCITAMPRDGVFCVYIAPPLTPHPRRAPRPCPRRAPLPPAPSALRSAVPLPCAPLVPCPSRPRPVAVRTFRAAWR